MATPNIVVVESPAKAKTINKYLGTDFTVLASYGHVRDLMAKDGSVNPDANFAMTWEVDAKAKQRLADISTACKNADRLFLATDPDREGEAISWHIEQELARNKALNGLKIQRVVFHEITKRAILHAMEKPRDINPRPRRCLFGKTGLGLFGRLYLVTRAVAQTARGKICWARPIRGLAVNL